MTNLRLALIGVVFSAVGSLISAEEAEIKRLLPGVWIANHDFDGVKLVGETEFKIDGTVAGKATVQAFGQKLEFSYEGKWVVKGSSLEYTITKTTDTHFMKVGEVTTDEILEITDAALKYKDKEGLTLTEKRKK